MKFLVLSIAFAALTFAQGRTRSPAFELVVLSATNTTLNGTTLDACHEGAAIEGLCKGLKLGGSPQYYDTFYFNSSSENTDPKAFDIPGSLSYDLVIADNQTVPSTMRLGSDLISNVAVPVLYPTPDEYTQVYFDSEDLLYLLSSRDDTIDPSVQKDEKIYQWYVCTTYYAYTYDTLAWTVGKNAKPENPTCQKVSVKRVWF